MSHDQSISIYFNKISGKCKESWISKYQIIYLMQLKTYTKAIVVFSIMTPAVFSIFAASVATSYAFLGFDLTPGNDQSIKSSQNTMQGNHCYSPDASIINSCNSGDSSETEYLGQNYLAQ
jgi:hypothetical protein